LLLLIRALIASGNANNGGNAGFTCSNSNNSAANTNANIGSQLCLKFFDEVKTVPLGKKSRYFNMVLVGFPNAPFKKAK